MSQSLEFPTSNKCLWMGYSLVTHAWHNRAGCSASYSTNPCLHTFHLSVYQNLNVRHNIIYLKTEKNKRDKNSIQAMNLRCHGVLSAKENSSGKLEMMMQQLLGKWPFNSENFVVQRLWGRAACGQHCLVMDLFSVCL